MCTEVNVYLADARMDLRFSRWEPIELQLSADVPATALLLMRYLLLRCLP